MLQFYAYILQHRINEEWILRAGRLLRQFIVDAYACIEQNRLKFIRENQRQLRCDLYNCRNPSLGLRPRQGGVCKVAGLVVDSGVTSHAPGNAKSPESVRE